MIAPDANGWMPIETAPKDGAPIDVWTFHGERFTDVWWEAEVAGWLHYWADDYGGIGRSRFKEPVTHWRPSPKPPVAP